MHSTIVLNHNIQIQKALMNFAVFRMINKWSISILNSSSNIHPISLKWKAIGWQKSRICLKSVVSHDEKNNENPNMYFEHLSYIIQCVFRDYPRTFANEWLTDSYVIEDTGRPVTFKKLGINCFGVMDSQVRFLASKFALDYHDAVMIALKRCSVETVNHVFLSN